MTPWETILLAFGGNAILIGALAWLAKSLLQNWLSKDVEAFKSELLNESTLATERVRHELGITALEHQVRFSKLHERRAEVIAEAYAKLVEAYWSFESFASPVERGGEQSKSEKFVEALNKSTDFFRYFDKNRIFLPADICKKLDEFIQGMRREAVGFGVWVQMEQSFSPEHVSTEKFEAWTKAWKYFENEAPAARKLLENEFRTILSTGRA